MKFSTFYFLKNQELKQAFCGKSYKYVIYFLLLISLNTVAALLEGVSFGMLTLALTTFNNTKILETVPLIQKLTFITHLTHYTLFIFFSVCAVAIQILRSGLTYLGQLQTSSLSLKIQGKLQKQIFQQILRLTFPCVSQYKTGDLVEYVNTPFYSVGGLMSAVNNLLLSGLTLCTLTFLMLKLSVMFSLAIFFLFTILGLLQHVMIKKICEASKCQTECLTDLNKTTVQNLQGLRIIHLFNKQKDITNKVNSLIDLMCFSTRKLFKWTLAIPPLNETIGISLIGVCLIIGPFFLQVEKEYLIPYLLSFLTITYRFSTRTQTFMCAIKDIASGTGYFLRIEKILNNTDKEFVAEEGKSFQGLESSIEFQNLSFHYQPHLLPALKQLNFTLHKGTFIAIVGHSGAGKSSLIDLLLRLYVPSSGHILVNGCPLQEYSISSWRTRIGVVSQDAFIFNETIEENIRFGCKESSYETLVENAKISGVHEFVSLLPEGYHTIVGERGYRLSERQRISLARALFRNPEILVLDEATSNLDSYSEYTIQQSLEKLRHKITIIAIAHRLSTIMKADSILVLQNGELIEQGSHKDLMLAEGYYANLWHVQSPAYKVSL